MSDLFERMVEEAATAIELCDKPYSSEHLARAALIAALREMREPSPLAVIMASRILRRDLSEAAWVTDDEIKDAWRAMLDSLLASAEPASKENGDARI